MTTAEAEIEHLRADIQKLRGDIENLGTTLGRMAHAKTRDATEMFRDATADLRGDVQRAAGQVTGKIEENPVTAALAALGIGMLLGRLCSGRRD